MNFSREYQAARMLTFLCIINSSYHQAIELKKISLSRIEVPDERSTIKWFDAPIPFLIEEVIARYIHKSVDEFPQTHKP